MKRLLYGVYFSSGASALIFEVLWFHQAGLAFGNSVWASSLVLTGFMAGLALGSVLAAQYGDGFVQPLRVYMVMELIIALTGVGLIYLLPALGSILGPLLSPWMDHPWAMNSLRLFLSFFLLLIPSTAMGVTLPLLTKVLMSMNSHFGSVLGKLYGWNTLGAVMGVIVSEICWIEYFGIHGTGFLAAGLNIMAAAMALEISRTVERPEDRLSKRGKGVRLSLGSPWLSAVFLSGFCLLALEVVWFRFLTLYVLTTSLMFALMLAIVLAGIGAGGLAGSFWLTRQRNAFRHAGSLAILAGALCAGCYAGFSGVVGLYGGRAIFQPMDILCIGVPLMFPVSFMSGVFFVLAGAALRSEFPSDIQTTGSLTLANTLGAALGSFIGGFVMLPKLGMEKSFFVIACLYGILGLFLHLRKRAPLYSVVGASGIWILTLTLFPFGVMQRIHLRAPSLRYGLNETNTLVATREGLTETISYVKTDWFGKTVGYRMITNCYSMSSSIFYTRRYMKLYIYLPVALHPNLKKALLISYGVGSTAKALTDTRSIETIDIVDISRDILESNAIIYPNPADQPLRDPRVRVHIEDGRYFLQTSTQHFDLITGEPPPPTSAGVVNLYTREYFQLMHERLAEGGMATYWLPMHSLSDESAKSIMKSFCEAFADCSLWTGMGSELMMVGTRNAKGPVSEEHFTRQWKDPLVRDELKVLGFEKPEQLGALFIGDAAYLDKFLENTPPLVDNFPKRILSPGSEEGFRDLFRAWTNTAEAKERFIQSPLIKRLWPERLRAASLPYFDIQKSLNAYMNILEPSIDRYMPYLHRLLTETRLETPVIWFLGGNPDLLRSFDSGTLTGMNPLAVQYLLGMRALSERKYGEAVGPFQRAEELPLLRPDAFRYRIYALCMSRRVDLAQRLVKESSVASSPFWDWMKKMFGMTW